MSQLIQNAAFIPEDDVYIVSSHQHGFVTHVFRDKLELSVDGGLAYCRRAGDLYKLSDANRYEEYCLTEEDPFEVVSERLLWGSRGKDGTSPLTFRPIKELSLDHLKAILANVPSIASTHKLVIKYWVERKEEAI